MANPTGKNGREKRRIPPMRFPANWDASTREKIKEVEKHPDEWYRAYELTLRAFTYYVYKKIDPGTIATVRDNFAPRVQQDTWMLVLGFNYVLDHTELWQ